MAIQKALVTESRGLPNKVGVFIALAVVFFVGLPLGGASYSALQDLHKLDSPEVVSSDAATLPSDMSGRIIGKYTGRCSLGQMFTEFNLSSSGDLVGTYHQAVSTGTYYGTLDNAMLKGKRAVSFTWHDQYGSGPGYFEFAPDYSSFKAVWKNDKDADLVAFGEILLGILKWDGNKSSSDDEPQQDSKDSPVQSSPNAE